MGRTALSLILASVLTTAVAAQGDPLASGFENPPESARPRVWWNWVDGNVTQNGIRQDLEWMRRTGLAGYQLFDVSLGLPPLTSQRVVYTRREWQQALRYAVQLTVQLGLEGGIAASPGWSETGGPWVPPADAMKKYVWSETRIEGGRPFDGVLATPPAVTGAFQAFGSNDIDLSGSTSQLPTFYADSAVIAYRALPGELEPSVSASRVTFSGPQGPESIGGGDPISKPVRLPLGSVGTTSWIKYEFEQPQTFRALTLSVAGGGSEFDVDCPPDSVSETGRALEASGDGTRFWRVVMLPCAGFPHTTVCFPPVTARFFRVTFKRLPGAAQRYPFVDARYLRFYGRQFGSLWPPPPSDYTVSEFTLYRAARVHRLEDKAAFTATSDLYGLATPDVPASETLKKSDVWDLTSRMSPDGHLHWMPPPGHWMVLRFGYSLLGSQNHPAARESTGLEVDKLNAVAVKRYMDQYLGVYQRALGADLMGHQGISTLVNDSWEAGSQNWTDDLIKQFEHRRGYDPRPWMPVLAGRIVGSASASDRFLWDFRKTIADLVAEAHYGQVHASARAHGLVHYSEAHEIDRAFVGDGMEVKKLDDVPMSAMWTVRPDFTGELPGLNADDRESASVAHIYGQNIAAAESFSTASTPWAWSPASLKRVADAELLQGINRFVIQSSVHQPLVDNKAPGLPLGPFGQWFTRNETWAADAGAWIKYLARSSYLLQQGRFSADVLYYYGEDSNLTALFADHAPPIPDGYAFDYVNADALIHELSVKDNAIVTKSGMRYRLLVLDPNSRHMSLPVLRALWQLVASGAAVVGEVPTDTPSLADNDMEWRRVVTALWGSGNGTHTLGRGMLFAGQTVSNALKNLEVVPDFDYSGIQAQSRIPFIHRSLSDGEIYFLANRSDRDVSFDAHFRVAGYAAELWHAETGARESVSYRIREGRTSVPLRLEPWGTVFVVFRKPAVSNVLSLPPPHELRLASLAGPWNVAFQKFRGAPPSLTFNNLISWTENTNRGVRYFSGSATYNKAINAPSSWFKPQARLWIELGEVKELARVNVNGKDLGVLWHAPFRVEVTSALKPGINKLSIRVTNLWVNRLIGDAQTGVTTRYAFTIGQPYAADASLVPAGLLGPVTIVRTDTLGARQSH